ncbi:hypothetical protein MIR68_006054 [Amoeboaphelidium protococcarum]|nr:hypothetical protein MIR68_006054 [Amoeboaphelidium protococcarum]
MQIDLSPLEIKFIILITAFALCYGCVRYLVIRWRRIHPYCHYCSQRVYVPSLNDVQQSHGAGYHQFKCTQCGSLNKYDRHGNVMDVEVDHSQEYSRPQSPSRRRQSNLSGTLYSPSSIFNKQQSGTGAYNKSLQLCESCQDNQRRKVDLLRRYDCPQVGSEEKFAVQASRYEAHIESMFPLCAQCELVVEKVLNNSKRFVMADAMNRMLTRSSNLFSLQKQSLDDKHNYIDGQRSWSYSTIDSIGIACKVIILFIVISGRLGMNDIIIIPQSLKLNVIESWFFRMVLIASQILTLRLPLVMRRRSNGQKILYITCKVIQFGIYSSLLLYYHQLSVYTACFSILTVILVYIYVRSMMDSPSSQSLVLKSIGKNLKHESTIINNSIETEEQQIANDRDAQNLLGSLSFQKDSLDDDVDVDTHTIQNHLKTKNASVNAVDGSIPYHPFHIDGRRRFAQQSPSSLSQMASPGSQTVNSVPKSYNTGISGLTFNISARQASETHQRGFGFKSQSESSAFPQRSGSMSNRLKGLDIPLRDARQSELNLRDPKFNIRNIKGGDDLVDSTGLENMLSSVKINNGHDLNTAATDSGGAVIFASIVKAIIFGSVIAIGYYTLSNSIVQQEDIL